MSLFRLAHHVDSPGTSRAHLPPGGCGHGPRPTSETPPSELRAWEGTDAGQLWGAAHRTMPWPSGHTTTDPQETPGQHLPGGPAARHTGDTLSATRKHTSEYTGNGNLQSPAAPPPALRGGYAVNMRHRGECESQSACMAQRCCSQSACMAHRCGSQSACIAHRCESQSLPEDPTAHHTGNTLSTEQKAQ